MLKPWTGGHVPMQAPMQSEATRRPNVRWAVPGLLLLGLAGCGGLEPVAPYNGIITDPANFFQSLTLNYRAIVLSTAPGHNTFQLTATPRNALGQPMEGLPTPTFRASDTNSV